MTKAIELSQLGNKLRVRSTGEIALGASADHRGGILTVGDVDSPTFARAAAAIKSISNDAPIGEANLYLEESSGAEGYYINVDSEGALLFSNSGSQTPTLKLDDSDNVLVGGIVLINDANISTNRADAPLQIETGGNGNALNLRARSSDNIYSYINFQNNAGSQTAAHIYLQRDASTNAGTLVFGTAAASANTPTENLYIQSNGRVGINRVTSSFMLDIVGNSSTGANAIRIVDGAETGHGSHPSKIVAGGTYYQEMQMHGRRFAVHTYDGSNIAETFRVHHDGNVGINDTSPSQKLNVGGNIMLEGSDQYMYLTNVGTGNAGIYVRGRTSTSELRSHSTGMFTWETTGSEKMRLTSDGQVHFGNGGFGTTKVGGQEITGNDTSATIKLYDTRANMWGMQLRRDTGTGPNGIFLRAGNSSSDYSLYVCGTNESVTHLACRGDGNVGIGTDDPIAKLTISASSCLRKSNGLFFFAQDSGGSNTNSNNTHWIGRVDNTGYHATSGAGGFNSVAGSLGIGAKGPIMFATSSATSTYSSGRMFINTSGNVGIGTSNPTFKLQVEGTTHLKGNVTIVNDSNTGQHYQIVQGYKAIPSSATWVELAHIGHSHSIEVQFVIKQGSAGFVYGGAHGKFSMFTAYGSSNGQVDMNLRRVAMNGGNITGDPSFGYQNSGGSVSYILRVQVPFSTPSSGNEFNISYVIKGISSHAMYDIP